MLIRLLRFVVEYCALLRLQLVDSFLNCNTVYFEVGDHLPVFDYYRNVHTEFLRKTKAIYTPSYDSLSTKKLTKHLGN